MLAIIIPYFKLSFFEATLESLSNQTDKRFKVYIGDDASPEDPTDLLERYKDKFDFTYHRFKTNIGGETLIKQWNRCVSLNEDKEWIMILGDDDVLGETVVESWYRNHEYFHLKSNLVRFSSKLIFENFNTISDCYLHPVWESATDSFYRKFKQISRSSLSEHIFSKASYEKYGFNDYPLAWNSDDRAWLDFSDDKPIFTINESIVFVRISSLNITGKRDNMLKKNSSEIEFYRFLIGNKFKFYNSNQRLEIIKKYGKEIRRHRSLKFSEWLLILYYCLKFFNVEYLKKGFNMILSRFKK